MKDIEQKLDRLYKEYIDYLNEIKLNGCKVMRNSLGQHKVEIRFSQQDFDINTAFGGIFKDIFGGA